MKIRLIIRANFIDILFLLAFTLSFVKVTIQMKARKLIGLEAMLDYQDPSANPIHDPKKGSSGGKGGNNP
jgi:hypothetical protein